MGVARTQAEYNDFFQKFAEVINAFNALQFAKDMLSENRFEIRVKNDNQDITKDWVLNDPIRFGTVDNNNFAYISLVLTGGTMGVAVYNDSGKAPASTIASGEAALGADPTQFTTITLSAIKPGCAGVTGSVKIRNDAVTNTEIILHIIPSAIKRIEDKFRVTRRDLKLKALALAKFVGIQTTLDNLENDFRSTVIEVEFFASIMGAFVGTSAEPIINAVEVPDNFGQVIAIRDGLLVDLNTAMEDNTPEQFIKGNTVTITTIVEDASTTGGGVYVVSAENWAVDGEYTLEVTEPMGVSQEESQGLGIVFGSPALTNEKFRLTVISDKLLESFVAPNLVVRGATWENTFLGVKILISLKFTVSAEASGQLTNFTLTKPVAETVSADGTRIYLTGERLSAGADFTLFWFRESSRLLDSLISSITIPFAQTTIDGIEWEVGQTTLKFDYTKNGTFVGSTDFEITLTPFAKGDKIRFTVTNLEDAGFQKFLGREYHFGLEQFKVDGTETIDDTFVEPLLNILPTD